MRALLCEEFGPLDQLKLETVDAPQPKAGEVAVAVRAAGLNFPDLLIVQGRYQARPPLPFVPGGECAGVVSAVGEGVDSLRPGDRVIAMGLTGAFGETMVAPASDVLPMPDGLDFATAAGVAITYGTSYYALHQRAALQAGETVLVLGAAGGVGMAAIELAKVLGARVIAAASTAEKLDAAVEAGADLRIDYSTEPLKQRVKELTDGHGADVIVDPVGGEFSEQAFRAAAWGGRHLVIGFAAGEIPKLPLNLALLKGASLCGVFWGTWTQKDPEGSRRNIADLQRWFEQGKLRPRITTFPIGDFRAAFASLAERRAIGKVVLTFDDA